ncbi:hypothetical protein OPT61_g6458 [Boeremia exigua]|uniref:Uncharacterized protein n=1 Tax=Boeremia exigua TaxID=749465 RepID=A0ACC2I6L0_9PLEO|nr:hypothetical protein OPT61_g6458 [Boeremia exigua]
MSRLPLLRVSASQVFNGSVPESPKQLASILPAAVLSQRHGNSVTATASRQQRETRAMQRCLPDWYTYTPSRPVCSNPNHEYGLMDTLARLYPPLVEREPIPVTFIPATFALTLLPFFFSKHRRQVALAILPVLLSVSLLAPCYTFGDPSADFYRSSAFIIMPLWFIDFAVMRSEEGHDAPGYVGASRNGNQVPQRIEDCPTAWSKLCWAVTLMVPSHRGIGWNWQIKNIPLDPNLDLSKRDWIIRQAKSAVLAYLQSIAMLVMLGFTSSLQQTTRTLAMPFLNALIGWSGAIWIYSRLTCFYSTSSALTVALGFYEIWQLPPLMGSVRDAWSVRQFWAMYHQTMRQMVSQPALRITRMLGLQKGTRASAVSQLFIAFFVSCLVHQYQMFNVTRRDMGEFAFFMSQPVAICFESGVMWLWHRHVKADDERIAALGRICGYAWVFLWFSITLPIYLKGSRDAGIVRDALVGNVPFEFGAHLAGFLVTGRM